MTPKILMTKTNAMFELGCDPTLVLPETEQTITVYPPPLFVFSPGICVYDAKSIVTFKGYLSSFHPSDETETKSPDGMTEVHEQEGEPFSVIVTFNPPGE